MTNNQLTREWLQHQISEIEVAGITDSNTLAAFKLALAAMDSEPVCFVSERNLATLTKYRAAVKVKAEPVMVRPVALYRHAQQPVVPDEILCEFYEVDSWPDLVRELVKHVEQLQDSAKRNVKPWEDTFPETLLPAYIDRIKQADEAYLAAMLQAVNSPVIPDGYVIVPKEPTDEMNRAGWAAMNEHDAINPTYRAMLAAAPQEVKSES